MLLQSLSHLSVPHCPRAPAACGSLAEWLGGAFTRAVYCSEWMGHAQWSATGSYKCVSGRCACPRALLKGAPPPAPARRPARSQDLPSAPDPAVVENGARRRDRRTNN
mgnify:CR=1 FL=1